MAVTGQPPPRRHQRRRARGWTMPPGARYVGRPGRWGNPFRPGAALMFPYSDLGDGLGGDVVRDAAHAVALFRVYARISSGYELWVRQTLAGRDLVCWCPPDEPCHADVLLEIANSSEGGAS